MGGIIFSALLPSFPEIVETSAASSLFALRDHSLIKILLYILDCLSSAATYSELIRCCCHEE